MNETNWLIIPDDSLFSATHTALSEVYSQDEKWGVNRIQNNAVWNTILAEEVGEVAKEVLETGVNDSTAKLQGELIQVAAVALNWVKALQRGESPSMWGE